MDELDADDDGAFGRAVTARRAELGLTRKEVVLRCGLSYPYLADIESGRKRPSAKALHALAEALELRPSELLDRAEYLAHLTNPVITPPPGEPGRERGSGWAAGSGRDPGAAPGPGSSPGARQSRWFHDEPPVSFPSRVAPEAPTPTSDEPMRSWVRQVVREELGSFATGSTPAPASPPPAPDAPTARRLRPAPSLHPSIEAHLPPWLVKPARTTVDKAIRSVVVHRLRRLQPGATPEEVQTEVDAALDDLIRRATRLRGPD